MRSIRSVLRTQCGAIGEVFALRDFDASSISASLALKFSNDNVFALLPAGSRRALGLQSSDQLPPVGSWRGLYNNESHIAREFLRARGRSTQPGGFLWTRALAIVDI